MNAELSRISRERPSGARESGGPWRPSRQRCCCSALRRLAVRNGPASSYLVMTSADAAVPVHVSSRIVQSDVISDDGGIIQRRRQAALQLQMKDVGGAAPSPVNAITITQYHVEYIRSDGRNIQGVDVPVRLRRRRDGHGGRRLGRSVHAGARPGQARGAAQGARRSRRQRSTSPRSPASPSTATIRPGARRQRHGQYRSDFRRLGRLGRIVRHNDS